MSTPFYRNIASGTTGGYRGLTPATTDDVKDQAAELNRRGPHRLLRCRCGQNLACPARSSHRAEGHIANFQLPDHGLEPRVRSGRLSTHVLHEIRHEYAFLPQIASGTTGGYGGLTPSTAYYVKVKALNSAGGDLTAYSSAVIARTLAAPPAPPAGLKSTAQSTTTLTFTWGAVPNAPQYRLARAAKLT